MDLAAEMTAAAARKASGRLDVAGSEATARILLREGRICTVEHATARPALGMRLVSAGMLTLGALAGALTLQKQHPDMRLGDILVRMGRVSRQEVESAAWEELCDEVAALLRWQDPAIRFTPEPAESLPAAAHSVDDVLAAATERSEQWQRVMRHVGGADTVPTPADDVLGVKDLALRPADWAVLCRVDGQRSLRSIAAQTGLTTLEAASIVDGLLAAGLVAVPETHLRAVAAAPSPWPPADTTPAPTATIPAPPVRTLRVAAASPPPPPPPAPVAPAAADDGPRFDAFDDPADLLRELSQLSLGAGGVGRRHGR